jgi:hypothetical protein
LHLHNDALNTESDTRRRCRHSAKVTDKGFRLEPRTPPHAFEASYRHNRRGRPNGETPMSQHHASCRRRSLAPLSPNSRLDTTPPWHRVGAAPHKAPQQLFSSCVAPQPQHHVAARVVVECRRRGGPTTLSACRRPACHEDEDAHCHPQPAARERARARSGHRAAPTTALTPRRPPPPRPP